MRGMDYGMFRKYVKSLSPRMRKVYAATQAEIKERTDANDIYSEEWRVAQEIQTYLRHRAMIFWGLKPEEKFE